MPTTTYTAPYREKGYEYTFESGDRREESRSEKNRKFKKKQKGDERRENAKVSDEDAVAMQIRVLERKSEINTLTIDQECLHKAPSQGHKRANK